MRKVFSVLLILLLCFECFALNIQHSVEKHDFDSEAMLDKFFVENSNVTDYWNDVKISLVTVSPGDALYSWFGHTGLYVESPYESDVMYDYGRFAFSKSFYINFIKGVLWYTCGASYGDYEIERFAQEKRSVSKIELDLTPEQKKSIVDFLQTNCSTPYRQYLYYHFEDNCATRIRDIINRATNGEFENWAKAQPGYTFREQTSRILHRNMFVEWVLDFVQGPSVDIDATLWDEMFLPENLEKAVLNYGLLTKEHSYMTDFRGTNNRPDNYEEPQPYIVQSMIAGFILAVFLLISYKWAHKAFIIENSILNFVLALLGSILFYMMFFSGHSFSWNNENILFVNPLLLITFILGFKHKKHNKVLTAIYGVLTTAVTAIIIAKFACSTAMSQANLPQLLSLLPIYMANFAICLFEVL